MNNYQSTILSLCSLCIISVFSVVNLLSASTWNISTFGELCHWSEETGVLGQPIAQGAVIDVPQSNTTEWNAGIWWREERDIHSIEITYDKTVTEAFARETKLQYWFREWPGAAPRSHTIEDNMDDPWQGEWLAAQTQFTIEGNKVLYTFQPLSKEENPRAGNLPEAVQYRRTLKIRTVYAAKPPRIRSLKVYSPTKEKRVCLRIEFGCGRENTSMNEGTLKIFNGQMINGITGWQWDGNDKQPSPNTWKMNVGKDPKGIIAELRIAEPSLPGSNDLTVVTVQSSEGTFSFLADDLNKGPIYIPGYSTFITYASDSTTYKDLPIKKGLTVREKLRMEPEQTYDRACNEIPKLSVMRREGGERLYLPIAADASWQKFAFEWGGNFYLNKRSTKAKGRELERCIWKGNELHWYVGTGENPVYLRNDTVSQLSILNDYLPVPIARWNHEGLIYEEEAFVTLLAGPLSPYDARRSEQTPAIMMVKLNIANPTSEGKTAHVWLRGDSLNDPLYRNNFIFDRLNGMEYIRAYITLSGNGTHTAGTMQKNSLHQPIHIPANQSLSIYIYVPFPGDLTEEYASKIAALNYTAERQRVISYWREIVSKYAPYSVPERKFNEMAKSIIPHIRISTTKDPKSGLFMVPAATFGYQVYSNESSFQTLFLDRIGDHETSANYLETFLKLQGTDPLPGTFTGDQRAVFHGGKVDNEYNYTSGPYNLDHGTVLWAMAQHYLMSHDAGWLNHAVTNMLLAADWIIEQRKQTMVHDSRGERVLHYGLIPAGRLEDNSDWGFYFANNAYSYLGLYSTARAFRRAGLPEAGRLEKEAVDYLSDIRTAVKRTSESSPVVRLRNNTYVPYVPTRVYQRFRYFGPLRSGYYSRYGEHTLLTYRLSATREVLYGPMILITTGILDPHDPLSEAILDDWEDNLTLTSSLGLHVHGVVDDEYWFSRGGMVFQPNLQNPIQAYLMRNEIPAAIRNLYNAMVSCLYRDVNAFTEEYRRWGVGSGPMYKIPDESRFVNRVCDLLVMESGNELWLAPGTPRRWLEPGNTIKLNNAETIFGSVSFEMHQGTAPQTIEATITLPQKYAPEKVLLFVRSPFDKPIKSVHVNSKEWHDWEQEREAIVLPAEGKKVDVVINY